MSPITVRASHDSRRLVAQEAALSAPMSDLIGQNRLRYGDISLLTNVAFGSKTEVSPLARHVRSTLKSRHRQVALACLFGAQ
jgi:hypothetical protein